MEGYGAILAVLHGFFLSFCKEIAAFGVILIELN